MTKQTHLISVNTLIAAREALSMECSRLVGQIDGCTSNKRLILELEHKWYLDALKEIRSLPEGGEQDSIRDMFERDCT